MELNKILYPVIGRFPSEKAKTIQIIRTSSWFVKKNVYTTLIFPKRKSQSIKIKSKKELMKFYNVSVFPNIIELINIDLFNSKYKKIAWYLHVLSYLIILIPKILFFRVQKYNVLYLRDWELLFIFSFMKKLLNIKIFFEIHILPPTFLLLRKICLSKIEGIIAISENLKNSLKYVMNLKNIEVIPDAFQPSKLKNDSKIISKIRKKWKINSKSQVIIYTGHLYQYKNVEFLIRAMKYLQNKDIILLIVGGCLEDIERIKRYIKKLKLKNVILTGFIPPYLIPYFHKIGKVGIITSNPKIKEFRSESPLKLFEYMGSKLPIIAIDAPNLRSIIKNGVNGILTPLDSPKILAEKIEFLLNNPEFAKKIALNAYNLAVNNYTYENRAINIINFIKKNL
ncbi:MAG: glycosyltransferase [Candidatus Helarchaeota archaeon]